MKGVSTVIVAVLLLMITVSLASFGYLFFTQIMSATTKTGTEVVEQVSSSLLSSMRIESVTTDGHVYVRNTGTVNLKNFSVYVNDVIDTSITVTPSVVSPGGVADINLLNSLNPGDIIKVTIASGAVAIQPVAGVGGGTGLIGYWKFDEGSGTTAYDSSGNGNSGTLLNNPTWAVGRFGSSLQFSYAGNGTTSGTYVSLPASSTLNSFNSSQQLTVTAWVNPTTSNCNQPIAAAKTNQQGTYRGFTFDLINMVPTFYANTSGTAASSSVSTSQWSHVAATYNNGNVVVYVNGVQAGSSSGNPSIATSSDLVIGLDTYIFVCPGSYGYFNGKIDEVKIFNRALTSNEVQSEYGGAQTCSDGTAYGSCSSTKPLYCNNGNLVNNCQQCGCPIGYSCQGDGSCKSNLAAYWKFDEGSGMTVSDSSGNGNTIIFTDLNNVSWTNGRLGNAINFSSSLPESCVQSGTDVKATMNPSLTSILSGPFTYSTWVNTGSSYPRTILHINSQYSSPGCCSGLWFRKEGNEMDVSLANSSNLENHLTASYTFYQNTWYYITYVLNSTAQTIYVNGDLINSANVYGTFGTASGFHVGIYDPSCTDSFQGGTIDEVQIWNRSLSADEIKELYRNGTVAAIWHFDEGSGTTAYDSSGNGNSGTLINGPAWVAGKSGSALQFDGTNKYVNISKIVLPSNNVWTAELWFKTSTSGTLLSEQDVPYSSSPSSWDPFLYVETNGKLHGGICCGIPSLESSVAVNDNNWHHAVFVINSTTYQKLYLDGQLIGTDTTITPEGPYNYVYVGNGYAQYWPNTNDGWYFFNGTIDEVKIFNRALTSNEVQSEYGGAQTCSDGTAYGSCSSTKPQYCDSGNLINKCSQCGCPSGQTCQADGSCLSNLVASLSFNEGSGTIAYDSSSYHNDGSLQNIYPLDVIASNPSLEDPWSLVDNTDANHRIERPDKWDVGYDYDTSSKMLTLQENSIVKDGSSAIRMSITTDSSFMGDIQINDCDYLFSIDENKYLEGGNFQYYIKGDEPTYGDQTFIFYDSNGDYLSRRWAFSTELDVDAGNGWQIKSFVWQPSSGDPNQPTEEGDIPYIPKGAKYACFMQYFSWQTPNADNDAIFDKFFVYQWDSMPTDDQRINRASSGWVDGKYGKALRFDGINDYVNIGNPSSLQLTGDMTISFWTYPTNVAEARENPIDKAYCGEFALTQETDGSLDYYQGPNGGETDGYMNRWWGNIFANNQWVHVALVRNVSAHSIRLYKNGTDQGEGGSSWANPSVSSEPVTIGDGYAGSGYHGIIDEVKIFNRVLSDSEIRAEYGA